MDHFADNDGCVGAIVICISYSNILRERRTEKCHLPEYINYSKQSRLSGFHTLFYILIFLILLKNLQIYNNCSVISLS